MARKLDPAKKSGLGKWGIRGGPLGVHDLGPIWSHLGPLLFGAHLGPVWGPLGPILGPFWAHLGPFLFGTHFWALFAVFFYA